MVSTEYNGSAMNPTQAPAKIEINPVVPDALLLTRVKEFAGVPEKIIAYAVATAPLNAKFGGWEFRAEQQARLDVQTFEDKRGEIAQYLLKEFASPAEVVRRILAVDQRGESIFKIAFEEFNKELEGQAAARHGAIPAGIVALQDPARKLALNLQNISVRLPVLWEQVKNAQAEELLKDLGLKLDDFFRSRADGRESGFRDFDDRRLEAVADFVKQKFDLELRSGDFCMSLLRLRNSAPAALAQSAEKLRAEIAAASLEATALMEALKKNEWLTCQREQLNGLAAVESALAEHGTDALNERALRRLPELSNLPETKTLAGSITGLSRQMDAIRAYATTEKLRTHAVIAEDTLITLLGDKPAAVPGALQNLLIASCRLSGSRLSRIMLDHSIPEHSRVLLELKADPHSRERSTAALDKVLKAVAKANLFGLTGPLEFKLKHSNFWEAVTLRAVDIAVNTSVQAKVRSLQAATSAKA